MNSLAEERRQSPFGLSLSKPPVHAYENDPTRQALIRAVLDWELAYGVAPQGVTGAVADFDAAMLVGHNPQTCSREMHGATAVRKGYDFTYRDMRYQVKGNRPSGKPGSVVTRTGKPSNLDWDYVVWVLYDKHFELQECWCCELLHYQTHLDAIARLRPNHWRIGTPLV